MTIHLRIILGFVVLLYFGLTLHFIKKKMLLLKYVLIWIFLGLGMAVLVLFPQLLEILVQLLGIETPMYGLLVLGIFCILLIMMSLTAIVSKQTERIKNLAQNNAMLDKKIRELENCMTSQKEMLNDKI